ncbi:MAG: hypothetical protein OHK0039_20140 [Bacteroidia bacterium]
MKDSKLMQVLACMRPGERQDFGRFVELYAPADAARLWALISSLTEDTQADAWDKTRLFAALYPGQVYQDKVLRTRMSQLFGLLQDYLAWLELRQRPWQRDLLALAQLRQRRADAVFVKQLHALGRKLDDQPLRDATYSFAAFELAAEANGYYGQQAVRTPDDSLTRKLFHLDAWYLAQKLKESCEWLNRRQVFAPSADNPLLDELLRYLREAGHPFWEVPAVRIYYQIARCLTEEQDDSHYTTLVGLLHDFHGCFLADEVRDMYKHAQNYCIRRINAGRYTYLQALFSLYLRQLETGVIYQEGLLAHTDFKNIVTAGLRLGQHAWVAGFMETQRERVPLPHRDNVYAFSLASCYFEQGEAQKAIRLLQSVGFTDVYYALSARHLLLKIFYEQMDVEGGLYQAASLATFVRRQQELAPRQRQQHLGFLRLYKKLLRLRERYHLAPDPAAAQQLLDKLHRSAQIANLDWLKEKTEALTR